jgi:hypothetical protein
MDLRDDSLFKVCRWSNEGSTVLHDIQELSCALLDTLAQLPRCLPLQPHPAEDPSAVGIECEGATYHSAKAARDRDRLRQEVLEQIGWRLYRIWSTDWFADPDRETTKLIGYLQELATDRNNRHPQRQGPLPTPDLVPSSSPGSLESRAKVLSGTPNCRRSAQPQLPIVSLTPAQHEFAMAPAPRQHFLGAVLGTVEIRRAVALGSQSEPANAS